MTGIVRARHAVVIGVVLAFAACGGADQLDESADAGAGEERPIAESTPDPDPVPVLDAEGCEAAEVLAESRRQVLGMPSGDDGSDDDGPDDIVDQFNRVTSAFATVGEQLDQPGVADATADIDVVVEELGDMRDEDGQWDFDRWGIYRVLVDLVDRVSVLGATPVLDSPDPAADCDLEIEPLLIDPLAAPDETIEGAPAVAGLARRLLDDAVAAAAETPDDAVDWQTDTIGAVCAAASDAASPDGGSERPNLNAGASTDLVGTFTCRSESDQLTHVLYVTTVPVRVKVGEPEDWEIAGPGIFEAERAADPSLGGWLDEPGRTLLAVDEETRAFIVLVIHGGDGSADPAETLERLIDGH